MDDSRAGTYILSWDSDLTVRSQSIGEGIGRAMVVTARDCRYVLSTQSLARSCIPTISSAAGARAKMSTVKDIKILPFPLRLLSSE